MSAATNRIVRLQQDVEHLQNNDSLLRRYIQDRDDTIIRLQQTISKQTLDLTDASKQIEDLKADNRRHMELIKQQQFIMDTRNELNDSLKSELEQVRKELEEAKSKIEAIPLTPPATPAPVSCNCKEDRAVRKRMRFTPDTTVRDIRIHELKFRSNNRTMFRCSLGEDGPTKEYHVSDIANNFPEQTKEFLASKMKFRKGKQIATIKERDIPCLIEILEEIEEDQAIVS